MDLTREETIDDLEEDDMERQPLGDTPLRECQVYWTHYQGMVRQKTYIFDGYGIVECLIPSPHVIKLPNSRIKIFYHSY